MTVNYKNSIAFSLAIAVSISSCESNHNEGTRRWAPELARQECSGGIGFRITQEQAIALALSNFKPICGIGRKEEVNTLSTKVKLNKCEINVVIEESINCIHGGALYTIDGRTGKIVDVFSR
jgi:hypothetical protein